MPDLSAAEPDATASGDHGLTAAAEPAVGGRLSGRRGLAVVLGVAVLVAVVDQLTKVWALASLDPGVRRPVLGTWLGLQLIHNPGAALSIATGMTWVLTIIAVVVVVFVVRASRRIASPAWAVTLGLLLGGAVGNLIDRLVRSPGLLRGEVVDFIAYGRLFIGNVADIAIVAAAGLVMVLVGRGVKMDGSREPAAGRRAEPAAPPTGDDG